MSRYRKIDPRIWNDAKFASLSDGGKLVFFMLLTHPSMTALGAMRATLPGLAAEIGWQAEAFAEAFREVSRKGMAEHDGRACLVALPNFIRYNPPESPNVVKAWASAVDLLPECDLKTRVIARAQDYAEGMTEGFKKAFAEAFPKGMPNQEQEPEQEQEKELSGASADADAPPRSDPIPYQAIVDEYNRTMEGLAKVRELTADRRTLIRSAWRGSAKRRTLGFWTAYFAECQDDPFLNGTGPYKPPHENWRPTFDYLLGAKVITKVFERALDRIEREGGEA